MGNNPFGCMVLICNLGLDTLIARNFPGAENVLEPYVNNPLYLHEIAFNVTYTYMTLFNTYNPRGGGGHPCNATCKEPPNLEGLIAFYSPTTEEQLLYARNEINDMNEAVYQSTYFFSKQLLSVIVD